MRKERLLLHFCVLHLTGVFKIPKTSSPSSNPTTKFPLTLVLDELRDPGNLGGILRTAAAVGVSQVLLLKGMSLVLTFTLMDIF